MSAPYNFTIGGIIVPIEASLEFSQSYRMKEEQITSDQQLGNCTTIRQSCTANSLKLITDIRGIGWVPAGLAGLNYARPMLIECIAIRSIFGLTTTITVPAKRRTGSGYEPTGWAIVDGEIVPTTISMNGNIATLGSFPGASGYEVHYTPAFNAMVSYSDAYASSGNQYSWSLTGEEL